MKSIRSSYPSLEMVLGLSKSLVLALATLLGNANNLGAASASDLLEKGIYAEETKGDLPAAIHNYELIIRDPHASPELVAQAQLRSGLCELKLGNKPKAMAALEQLTHHFPDKQKLQALIETQMPVLLDDILKQIEQNYFKEVGRAELVQTAIKAIIGKLDSQSDYLSEQDLAQLNRSMAQQIVGIGVKLKMEGGQILIETPLPGSPALKAGLRPGDVIVDIESKPTSDFPAGKELQTAVEHIQGKAGKTVTLGIRRPGVKTVQRIKVVRGVVQLPSVLGDIPNLNGGWEFMLGGRNKIGYVRLVEVGQRSTAEMSSALQGLMAQDLKGLILDLRGNGGGLLTAATEISDLFLRTGTIVTINGRNDLNQTFTAEEPGTFDSFPMVVLVNRLTASAAEIIAAALQDNGRAVIIGERTAGHGLVKSLIPLENGATALKLPTATFYRPNGKSIHRYAEADESEDWGVKPDPNCEVNLSESDLEEFKQYRRDRDTLGDPGKTPGDRADAVLDKAVDYLLAKLGAK